VTVADAGALAGAAVVDETGRVWGLMRDERHAVSASVLGEILDTIDKPAEKKDFARWRNLGISAAFFLGLCVWWVYRSKRLRY
jgi:hypothetical protein